MKTKLWLLIAGLTAGIVQADAPQIWLTQRAQIMWDAQVDALRVGWNVALVNSGTSATNMPANDAMRSQDTGNTNGVIRWVILTDPTAIRIDGLVKNLNWQNGNVMVSARDADGNYSDWASLSVYNPNPSNVRVK